MSDHFDIYKWSLLDASVCTDLPDDEATERLNLYLPTGIDSRWQISQEPTFLTGEPNPAPCSEGREGCRHVLFTC